MSWDVVWFDEVILPDRSTGVLHTFLATKKKGKREKIVKRVQNIEYWIAAGAVAVKLCHKIQEKLKDRLYGAKVDVINVK